MMRMMAALSMMLSVRRCMAPKAGLLAVARRKLELRVSKFENSYGCYRAGLQAAEWSRDPRTADAPREV